LLFGLRCSWFVVVVDVAVVVVVALGLLLLLSLLLLLLPLLLLLLVLNRKNVCQAPLVPAGTQQQRQSATPHLPAARSADTNKGADKLACRVDWVVVLFSPAGGGLGGGVGG